jgi:hypothetical protein
LKKLASFAGEAGIVPVVDVDLADKATGGTEDNPSAAASRVVLVLPFPRELRAGVLLQALYSIRSERLLMERLEYDLLFRWFVGIGIDDAVWDHSVFSKNRDRLLEGDIAAKFLAAIMAQPKVKRLLSTEHFSVDGTLIEAWASMKTQCGSGLPRPEAVERHAWRLPKLLTETG